MSRARLLLGHVPTADEIQAATDALWDNAIDGRNAPNSDFDAAFRALRLSFVRWLAEVV